MRFDAATLDPLGVVPVDLIHVLEEKGRGFTAYNGRNVVGTCYKSKSPDFKDQLYCGEQVGGGPFAPPELSWGTSETEDRAGLLYRPDGTRSVALITDAEDRLRKTTIVADATVPGDVPVILSTPDALGLDPYLVEGADGVIHAVYAESLD